MHRVTPILQYLWQDVADPWGFVVLEMFDGCDNLSQRDFWVGWVLLGDGGVWGGGSSTSTSGAMGDIAVNS